MQIWESGSRPSRPAPEAYFTGQVRMDPIVEAPAPARLRALLVTFEPGARTYWHTHPLGQALHVVSGRGLAQSAGGPVRELRPGDTVWFAPGERHWHGAAPECAMSHIALQEELDGRSADWLEEVSAADYAADSTG